MSIATVPADQTRPASAGAGPSGIAALFAPRSVAVIGASERPSSVGRTVVANLTGGAFAGRVYAVNPKRATVLDLPAYPAVGALPEPVDLAVIATPAPAVPGVIQECAASGVRAAIVLSAGFREQGPAGAALEAAVLAEARRGGLRLIGPNCLGVMRPAAGLNATFASGMALPGHVALLSQSGALCTAILDWSLERHVGFSAFVSLGSMLDVGWGDLITYLGDDPRTRSILLYMESIGDARAFLSAAREVALSKPIIVLKAGRSAAAAKAAASHTGALTGSDAVLDAAFRRCGVLRVERIAELFAMADVLAKQPRPKGPRLAIVTNAGGPAVLATDALLDAGGELAALSPAAAAALDAALPPHWSHANPVDALGDADPARFAAALGVVAGDTANDGVLALLTPQAMTDPTRTAEEVAATAAAAGKPVLASWMGGPAVAAGEAILSRAGVPTFAYPDTAARAFAAMWRHSDALRALYETPTLPPADAAGRPDRAGAAAFLAAVRAEGRTLLTEYESKELLARYGVPTTPCRLAATPDEAAAAADALGYPVAVKLHSRTLTHKTDVGGVRLDVRDAAGARVAFHAIADAVSERAGAEHFQGVTVQPMAARDGYELILGSSIDPQFGPVLLFGAGGQLVEVLEDRALGLPPLTTTLARRMVEETRIARALRGVRGRPPVDLDALCGLLVRTSQLVVEQPWIKELDINPLLAGPDGLLALDARVLLHGLEVREEDLPRPAIRPYPAQYTSAFRLHDGAAATLRPIRPEDEPLLARFHAALSTESVYLRYAAQLSLAARVAHERLARRCFIDYDREMALVAVAPDDRGDAAILGVGRQVRAHDRPAAEFSLLVGDRAQHQGLGAELLRRLIAVARAEGLCRLTGDVLAENAPMLHLCAGLGFRLRHERLEDPVRAELDL